MVVELILEGSDDAAHDPHRAGHRSTKEGALMTNEHAENLRQAYDQYVTHPEGHWKGEAIAFVPNADDKAIIDLVREAMNFHGSIVCAEGPTVDGRYTLFSKGYWANGF